MGSKVWRLSSCASPNHRVEDVRVVHGDVGNGVGVEDPTDDAMAPRSAEPKIWILKAGDYIHLR